VRYLQQAGEQAIRRSAYSESISLAAKGLELLQTLPETPERDRQELHCQVSLGAALVATKGYAAPEVETAYLRALDLCQRAGEAPHLFPVLWGLWAVYAVRADHTKALTLGERLLALAQQQQDPAFLVQAHWAMGQPLLFLGVLARAGEHFAQGVALYDPQRHRPDQSPVFRAGQDPGVNCLAMAARIPWLLGYPDQAVQKVHEALALAHSLRHPLTLGYALGAAAIIHQLRREPRETQECADTAIALCTEHGLSFYLALGRIWRGWTLTEQGELGEGIALLQQGLTVWRALGAEIGLTHYLTPLIEAHRKAGHLQEAETVLAEAFALVEKNAEHFYEAELYRLKGELILQEFQVSGSKFQVTNPQSLIPNPQAEAEACFQKAIEIARTQQAKSLELRATVSRARLWQRQGKKADARLMLQEICSWFTEGFDTADLEGAKNLLGELL
jgi:predicted ATPase